MSKKIRGQRLRNFKRRILWRLGERNWTWKPRPMLTASNIHYEVSGKARGIEVGGIGAIPWGEETPTAQDGPGSGDTH